MSQFGELPSPSCWRRSELETVRRLYPGGGWAAVQRALPHRNRGAIRTRAWMLGIRIERLQ